MARKTKQIKCMAPDCDVVLIVSVGVSRKLCPACKWERDNACKNKYARERAAKAKREKTQSRRWGHISKRAVGYTVVKSPDDKNGTPEFNRGALLSKEQFRATLSMAYFPPGLVVKDNYGKRWMVMGEILKREWIKACRPPKE